MFCGIIKLFMSKKDKFFTEKDKTLFSVFLFIFFIFIIIINWNDFSLFLNIRTAPSLIRQGIGLSETEKEREFEVNTVLGCNKDNISIPSISVSVPIVETKGTSERDYRDALDKGVVRFPNPVYPGDNGLLILLGHSAPEGWPKINHDWVFTEIEKLKEGDEIIICYKELLYTYIVIDEEIGKKIYRVGEDVPPLYEAEDKEELVLMTCWPPGDSSNRIGVRAVLK